MGEDAQSRGGGLLAKKRKPKVEFRSLERSFLHKAVILLHTSKAQRNGINSAIYIYLLHLADIAFYSFFARHYYYRKNPSNMPKNLAETEQNPYSIYHYLFHLYNALI